MNQEGDGAITLNGLEKNEPFSAPVLAGETTPIFADHVAAEINLESIGYFKAGYKRTYPKAGEFREVPVGETRFRFISSGAFGDPNTDDLDLYRGFLKICDEQADCAQATDEQGKPYLACKLPDPVTFSTDKLLQYAGRERSDHNVRAVRNFIRRHRNTGIIGVMKVKQPDGRIADVEMQGDSWLRAYVIVGELKEGKKATENGVSVGAWWKDNYERRYLKLLDVAFHQRLGTPIAKTLAPFLDAGWYTTKGEGWQKKYRDLAALLGIAEKRYLADVKRQLDPSHEELQRERYLERWEYTEAKDGDGFVLHWWAGEKWQEDQRERDRRRNIAYHLERRQQAKVKQREFRFEKPKRKAAPAAALPALTEAEQGIFQHVRQAVSPYFTLPVFQQFLRKGATVEDIQRGALACANAEKDGLITTNNRLSFFMDYMGKVEASIAVNRGGEPPTTTAAASPTST
jgi:hypothetical protein